MKQGDPFSQRYYSALCASSAASVAVALALLGVGILPLLSSLDEMAREWDAEFPQIKANFISGIKRRY